MGSPLLFGVLELGNWTMSILFYAVVLGVADLRVLIPLQLVRGVLAWTTYRKALAPVHAWQRGGGDDEQQLLDADRALSEFHRQFGPSYALGWVVAAVLAIAAGAADVPEPLQSGDAERLVGVMGVLAMGMGIGSIMRPFCDAYLPALREDLGRRLLARRLGRRRSEQSVGRRLLVFTLGMIAAVVLVLLAMSLLERAKGERARVQAEQRGRVATLALQLRAGTLAPEQLDADIAIVETDALPSALSADVTEPAQPLARTDVRHGLVLAAAPLDEQRWLLTRTEPELQLGRATLGTAAFVLVMLLMVGSAGTVLNRSIIAPLAQLDDAVQSMVEHGDLRALARIIPQGHDEIGALASNFNVLLDQLEDLARAAATVADGNLDAELDGRGQLQDAFRGMLWRLHEMVMQVRAAALEVAGGAAEIQAATSVQEDAVERQSQGMQDFRAAVETLARSAEDISKSANEVFGNAEQTLATANAVTHEIAQLNRQTASIGELLQLINEIADRSDLLALNGSLEATRAGEAGRGFALVASEMRRLAERVTGTVAIVRERVASVGAASRSAVEATDRSRALANETAAAAHLISTITREQSHETEQVSAKVHGASVVVSAAVASARQTRAVAAGLAQQAAELERLTARFKLRATPPSDR